MQSNDSISGNELELEEQKQEEEEDEKKDGVENQQQQPQQSSYQLHSINSTIVIRQFPSQGISFQLWPAATTLLNLLDLHRRHSHSTNPTPTPTPLSSLFDNGCARRLRLLELGSGTGLVGIAAAALLGAHVTLTDLPHVLPNLQFNVAANTGILELHGGAVNVAALQWGNTDDMEAIGREYDVILGSDVVYHDHLYEPLLQTLRYFLLEQKEKNVVFLMAHIKRWKKESSFFRKANKFFHVKVLHIDTPSSGSRVGVTVYQFARNCDQKLKSHSS